MKQQENEKKQRKHLNCVICGAGFNSEFDEMTKCYKVFHPEECGIRQYECENLFYKYLLRIYDFLHRAEYSIPMTLVIRNVDWENNVVGKKEMIMWCLSSGYLAIDSLKRLIIPRPIKEVCRELFDRYKLCYPDSQQEAIEYIKAALRCLAKELKQVSTEEIVEATQKPEFQLDTNESKESSPLKRFNPGMATVELTGVRFRDKRGNRLAV